VIGLNHDYSVFDDWACRIHSPVLANEMQGNIYWKYLPLIKQKCEETAFFLPGSSLPASVFVT
jgi:hypothetical protein